MNPSKRQSIDHDPPSLVAHVAMVECEQGEADQVVHQCQAGLIPLLRTQMGYRGIYILVGQTVGKVVCLVLWDTAEDARSFEKSDAYQAHVTAIADSIKISTSGQVYEVRIEA